MPSYLIMTCEKGEPLFRRWGLEAKTYGSWLYCLPHFPSPMQAQTYWQQLQEAIPAGLSFAYREQGFQLQAVFSDVDATLIPYESIELLAARLGLQEKVAAITREAMEGRRDFAQALRERLGLLAGLAVRALEDTARSVEPISGARELIAWCRQQGIPFYLVSGGFMPMLELWAENWQASGYIGNQLEVCHGRLTGHVLGEIVDANQKKRWMQGICQDLALPARGILAMGDGANDKPMLASGGLKVGFAPKPCLWREGLNVVNQTGSHAFLLDFLKLS